MTPAGFEPIIPTSERPKTHAFDHAATGIGVFSNYLFSVFKTGVKKRCFLSSDELAF
jgi:hypothetical protein